MRFAFAALASWTFYNGRQVTFIDCNQHETMHMIVPKIYTILSFIRCLPINRSLSMASTMVPRKSLQRQFFFTRCHPLKQRRPLIRADNPLIFIQRKGLRRIHFRYRAPWLHPQVMVRTVMMTERQRNLIVPAASNKRCLVSTTNPSSSLVSWDHLNSRRKGISGLRWRRRPSKFCSTDFSILRYRRVIDG